MEFIYTDRYKDELADIFNQILKIDISFNELKDKALRDYKAGLISESVFKEVSGATYNTVLSGEASKYALLEEERMLVLSYIKNGDTCSVFLDDLNETFSKLLDGMDKVAYSVKNYNYYYSMDLKTLRENVFAMMSSQYSLLISETEAEMKELSEEEDFDQENNGAYKALEMKLNLIKDNREKLRLSINNADIETLMDYIVKKYNINLNYWSWYRSRRNKEEYNVKAGSRLPYESTFKVGKSIDKVAENYVDYDDVVKKLLLCYQASNSLSQSLAFMNNSRKVIVNTKCNKKECFGIFVKLLEIPAIREYMCSCISHSEDVSDEVLFDLFYQENFSHVKSVDYDEFRLSIINRVFQYYDDLIKIYVLTLQSKRTELNDSLLSTKRSFDDNMCFVRNFNDLLCDSVDDIDYLGDVVPLEQRDRLYNSLKCSLEVYSSTVENVKKI